MTNTPTLTPNKIYAKNLLAISLYNQQLPPIKPILISNQSYNSFERKGRCPGLENKLLEIRSSNWHFYTGSMDNAAPEVFDVVAKRHNKLVYLHPNNLQISSSFVQAMERLSGTDNLITPNVTDLKEAFACSTHCQNVHLIGLDSDESPRNKTNKQI